MTPTPIELTKLLDDDDLKTLLTITQNDQSGRITAREIRILVDAYKALRAIGNAMTKEIV